ncbi:F-box protein At5g07610-like [Durio zibethinus]|uniref:F-box protein At5g07610-like n=1 Tax=Durio zibethinus TaxID=66656 RepID=A0A6P5WWD8_DURZI|nr:F-box protein At5g07610-like [Durio zibethinus]
MKKRKVMNSAEKIGNNRDMLTEILLRLPTKSLIKFKCVSKQWLSLISNPQFCLSHTRHHQHNGFLEPTALLLKVKNTISPEFDVVPLKHYSEVPFFHYVNSPDINMLQSCNGLFLCETHDDDVDNVSRYFICNPTTKKFKMLSFPRNPHEDCEFYVSLAFDPLKSPHYKIIAIRKVSKNSFEFEMDIYLSETDSWTVSGISFEVGDDGSIAFNDAVFCNGIIHWNSYGAESLYFDVGQDCLQKMPMPMPTRNNLLEIYRYFGETRGTLYLAVVIHHALIGLELNVYEMESDYSRWFFKHRLNIGDAMKIFPELNLGYRGVSLGLSAVCFIRSEKEEEPKVVAWADGKIIFYDFNDGAWKKHYDPGPGIKIGTRFSHVFSHLHEQRFLAYKYFENLSCI